MCQIHSLLGVEFEGSLSNTIQCDPNCPQCYELLLGDQSKQLSHRLGIPTMYSERGLKKPKEMTLDRSSRSGM